jgi:hypothetical protein
MGTSHQAFGLRRQQFTSLLCWASRPTGHRESWACRQTAIGPLGRVVECSRPRVQIALLLVHAAYHNN